MPANKPLKGKTSRKPIPAPPPPRDKRIDIVATPERQSLYSSLIEATREKTFTKAIDSAARYYIHVKPKTDDEIRQLSSENSNLKYRVRSLEILIKNFSDAQKALFQSLENIPLKDDERPSFRERHHCGEEIASDADYCPYCRF